MDTKANHHSSPGWYVDAKIATLAGEIGVSDYHRFAWAWCADTTGVYIEYSGVGFGLSGSGDGAAGTETHRSPEPAPPTPTPI